MDKLRKCQFFSCGKFPTIKNKLVPWMITMIWSISVWNDCYKRIIKILSVLIVLYSTQIWVSLKYKKKRQQHGIESSNLPAMMIEFQFTLIQQIKIIIHQCQQQIFSDFLFLYVMRKILNCLRFFFWNIKNFMNSLKNKKHTISKMIFTFF